MKNFIHNLGELKFITGLYFMAVVMLGSIGGYFHGLREFSFITIWQLMGMAIVFGALHYIQLSKLALAVRISVHVLLSYITVVLFSRFCNWGFTSNINVFWQFTAIFAGLYLLIFLLFGFYYNNEQKYLNKKLDEYKNKNK